MKSFAFAAAILAVVEGRNLARMEAQPTIPAVFALDGFSPVPTTPPLPEHVEIRAASSSSSPMVLLYNSDNTCGYISGISTASYYCINKGDYCALRTSADGFIGRIGCCGSTTCYTRTTCVNSAEIYISKACNTECRDNVDIVKCTDSGYPYCNTISFAGGVIDYACGVLDITTPQVMLTSYNGQVNPQTYTQYTVTASASASGAPPQTSSSSSSSSSSSPTPSNNNNSNNNNNNNNSNNNASSHEKKTPVGAIVGGVVGGVGALALAGVAIMLFLRNKKKKAALQSPPPPPMIQPGAPQQPQYAAPYSTSPGGNSAYYPPQQQGSPDSNYPYSQPSMSPTSPYSQQQPYGQPGFAQQPYQQSVSPPPKQHEYAAPIAGATAGAAVGVGAGAAVAAAGHNGLHQGAVHEAPTDTSDQHRGEMQELE